MSTFWNFNHAIILFFGSLNVMLFLCPAISGESVHYMPCPMHNNSFCEIENVAIDPCPEASENETCIAYRGSNSTMSFVFVPKKSAERFMTQTYSTTFLVDIPDLEHDSDGCKYSSCPIKANQKQTFSYTRFIKELYPAGTFLVKWKIWVPPKEECCFLVNVRLV